MREKVVLTVVLGIFLVSSVSAATWQNTDEDITLDASDDESGVENTFYCVDQSDSCQPRSDGQEYTGTFTVSDEGINYVRYNSRDNVGNIEDTLKKTVKIDYTDPDTSDDYPGGWLNNSITVDLTCDDPDNPEASGCDTIEYCIDSGNSCTPSTEGDSITFDTEGKRFLRYRSTDVAGNVENVESTEIKLDFTSPTVQVNKGGSSEDTSRNASVACTDALSGCDESSYQIRAGDSPSFECPTSRKLYEEDSPFEVNQHLWICGTAKDRAGNWDESDQSVEFDIGTLTTNMYYPGKPDPVITSVGSTVPISLEIGNEEDSNKRINITTEGPETVFSDGSKSREFVMEGIEDRRVNMLSRPDTAGNQTVEIIIEEKTEGFTVSKEVDIKVRERGQRTSSTGREVPGIGLVNVLILSLMASGYYFRRMRN